MSDACLEQYIALQDGHWNAGVILQPGEEQESFAVIMPVEYRAITVATSAILTP